MKKKKSWSVTVDGNRNQDPYNLNSDNTTNILELSSPRSTNLTQISVNWLKWKFRNAYYWVFGFREDKSMFKIPATVRGNETYAYYQNARIMQIQTKLKSEIKIENSTTNALFLTLTQRYDTNSAEMIDKTWTNTRPALRKFKIKLRKMGMINYAMTLEAHENGGCHAHMIAIFDKTIKMHATRGDKYRVNNIELIYKVKKAWADALDYDMDSAFVDILACGNTGLAGYIVKELKKTASCEKAIRNTEVNKDTPSDRKKILAFYFAGKNKMRLLYVSKGICATEEPDEEEVPTDLITNVITEPQQSQKVLYTCLIQKSELLKLIKYEEISPYTGNVEQISKEYEAVMSILDDRFRVSEVLGNKEEVARVLKQREERKMIKMQTKIIAQEACYEQITM
jgi:hypothetical protein